MNTTISTADPILRARAVYEQEECARSFDQDIYLHLNTPGCIVYKDASNLALLRPVNSHDPYRAITNPAFMARRPDAWWIYLLVGSIPFLVSRLPYDLPLIGWERKNSPRFYKLEQVKRWTLKDHTTPQIFSDLMAS